jgi:hypothetical protein
MWGEEGSMERPLKSCIRPGWCRACSGDDIGTKVGVEAAGTVVRGLNTASGLYCLVEPFELVELVELEPADARATLDKYSHKYAHHTFREERGDINVWRRCSVPMDRGSLYSRQRIRKSRRKRWGIGVKFLLHSTFVRVAHNGS